MCAKTVVDRSRVDILLETLIIHRRGGLRYDIVKVPLF